MGIPPLSGGTPPGNPQEPGKKTPAREDPPAPPAERDILVLSATASTKAGTPPVNGPAAQALAEKTRSILAETGLPLTAS